MATITKRSWQKADGSITERWLVSFTDQLGKRRHKQFRRKKDADAWLDKARGQVAEGTYAPDRGSITIRQAADLWLGRARAERLERSTIGQYERSVAIILALIDPATRLARLTTPRVAELRDDLLRSHSRPMAQKALKHLKAILREAKGRGLLAHDPAASVAIGAADRHKPRLKAGVDFPLPGELKALIEAASGKALALVCLAGRAGLRASELRGLRWADLELGQHPYVTISQRADRWSELGSPKSAAARRTVPLSSSTASALRAWKLAQPPGRALVFGTSRDAPDSLSNLRARLLAPLFKAAGVRPYGLHAFRHHAISAWLASGIDPKQCQEWAGHSDLSTTLNIYGHLIPRADAHQRIEAAERGL